MNRSPSQYGGVAALLVFGIGSLIVGFSMPPAMHDRAVSLRWSGAGLTVFGLLVMALTLTESVSFKALWVSIAAVIYCGLFGYCAFSNEMSGTANYHRHIWAKHDVAEAVTRFDSPDKFRSATNFLWGAAGVCLSVSVVSLVLYRKLGD